MKDIVVRDFFYFQICWDFEKLFGSDVAGRLMSTWSTVAKQIITLVSRDLNIGLTYGRTDEISVADQEMEIINFSNPRDMLNKNRIIRDDGKCQMNANT